MHDPRPFSRRRRRLLQAGAGLAGLGTLPLAGCGPDAVPAGEWRNWSGSQSSRPRRWLTPADEGELAALLRSGRDTVRVTGASHSFSALCRTDDILVSLDRLAGLVAHDAVKHQATVWAGTRLRDLGAPLWEAGQGLLNQGDVDPQSVGGACGTSTHGTGIGLGSFSANVRGVRLLAADGQVVEAGPDRNPEILHAAATSIGALGILTQVTLQNRPRYHLVEKQYAEPLRDILQNLEQHQSQNRHFEFWTFFEAESALVKTLNETDREPTPLPAVELPVDAVLKLTCEIAHGWKALDGPMQRLLMALSTPTERVGRSYEIFPSPRETRFNEMEYELPRGNGPACLEELIATVRREGTNTLFPLEYRTVAADDAWLSPFYGRDSASISVHQYHPIDYRPLFAVCEPILRKHGGRPHWGKLHTLTAKELAPLYPKWDDWQRVRRQLDPEGRFLNPHLRQVLGA